MSLLSSMNNFCDASRSANLVDGNNLKAKIKTRNQAYRLLFPSITNTARIGAQKQPQALVKIEVR